jgi:very-short-patch-repair endonuclease
MSPPEVLLWSRLRLLRSEGPKFRRQHPIGPYIADFCCVATNLVVEIDGAHHTEDTRIERDEQRDAYLRGLGCHVLRISAGEVLRGVDETAQGVVQAALYRIGQPAEVR